MESSLFRFIVRYSARQQLMVLALTVASFPALYGALELPKRIINDAIQGQHPPPALGEFAPTQTQWLFILSGAFLGLVLLNGAFKLAINTAKGKLGERMLRRLRYELYVRILRFPPSRFRKTSSGELIPMITAEVEPLGGFIGDALAVPAFQGGSLLVYLAFIFVQDPVLGLAAVALYPFQGWLIPRLQRRVNQLGKQRVRAMRGLADRIDDTVAGVRETHIHAAGAWRRADIAGRLGDIYDIRMEIYQRKFFIKFLNNFINQLTPFFFYSIGGWLTIRGQLSFGALVAVLAAYKDLASPWKELLDWYQQKEDARVKYEQVVEQFNPPDLLDPALAGVDRDQPDPPPPRLSGTLTLSSVSLDDDGGAPLLERVSCAIPLDRHTAIIGEGGGKSELAQIIARVQFPTAGQIRLGEMDYLRAPETVIGRRVAYVGPAAHVFTGSLRDNLVYGLLRPPAEADPPDPRRRRRFAEARLAGNPPLDLSGNWVDHAAAGCADPAALGARLLETLRAVDLDSDLYAMGLKRSVDPDQRPDIAARALAARTRMAERLTEPGLARLVERFDPDQYNYNATVAENLLFGAPVGDVFAPAAIAASPYIRHVLDRLDLTDGFIDTGRRAAAAMVEIFAGLEPGHAYFERFSFIDFAELPEYQAILERADKAGPGGLGPADRDRLLAIPFRLIPARHRLGLLDAAGAARLVAARHYFAAHLPAELRDAVAFFEPGRYNAAASIQDNILFGKLAHGQPQGEVRVNALLAEVVDGLNLRDLIVEAALDEPAGVNGARLTATQRQKIALARALVKDPDLLVLDDAINALDQNGRNRVMAGLRRLARGLVCAATDPTMAAAADLTLVMEGARLARQGQPTHITESHAGPAGGKDHESG